MSNDKSKSVNVLVLDEDAKLSIVTSSFVQLKDRGSKVENVKLQNVSNDKRKRVNILVLDKDAKVSTVTSLSDLRIRGRRSKKGQIEKCQITKLTVSMCCPWTNMQKCQR